ncbi:MAG: hypothetical protein RR472_09180, partial [Anaerovoracaceae bacterium]
MRYLSELIEKKEQITMEKESFFIENSTNLPGKKRLNLLALGDVGSTLLMGLRLMGGDILASIGICDISNKVEKRFEMEINQIMMPFAPDAFPKVHIAEDLFDCDVFVFCASKGVPPVAQTDGDVRMVQFAANKELISLYAKKALAANFTGKFYVVSDPVDPLCQAAVNAGLSPQQVRGYGLGVMNARAAYFSEEKSLFKTEGRV